MVTKAGAKELQLRALRDGPRTGTVSRSTIEETGTLLAGPNLDREEQKRKVKMTTKKQTKAAVEPKPGRAKKPAKPAAAKRVRVPGVDRSPLAVGTFIARKGGASMAEIEAQFKMDAHPLRAKIHAARHNLGFKIDYDAEKNRYFGAEPKRKAKDAA
jgi:hypothetical protein